MDTWRSIRRGFSISAEVSPIKVMGKRREPRHAVRIPVRIFGTDAAGQLFSENVHSYDISNQGARLDAVRVRLKVGEVIGLSQGKNKGRFLVKWVGESNTPTEGQIGLVSVAPEKSVWDTPLPAMGVDGFREQQSAPAPPIPQRRQGSERRQGSADRRLAARLKCTLSVQITPQGQTAPIWGNAIDLSMGGCFIEMPIPLSRGTKLKVEIWIKENKLRASGRVVSSRPGFGIGVQFGEMSQMDTAQLQDFLKSITQIPL